jgi:purine-nucleoside phosphorylase
MAKSLYDRASEAAEAITRHAAGRKPRAAVVLGSGLGGVADKIVDPIEIPYSDIPFLVPSTVDGHAGKLVIGSIGGVEVAVMKGRVHAYEGYSLETVTLPIRVFFLLGIGRMVLTNAAGSTSPHLGPGSLMLITDHINLMWGNPLTGPNDERFGPRFPDMTTIYTPEFIEAAHTAAREMGITLREGVYVGLGGPSYETPAEVRMLRDLGADAIGMSTVPEAIVARHSGMKVLGISCITNIGSGLSGEPLNHDEVMRIGAQAGQQLAELVIRVIPRLCESGG